MVDDIQQQLKAENAALRAELARHGLSLPAGVSPIPPGELLAPAELDAIPKEATVRNPGTEQPSNTNEPTGTVPARHPARTKTLSAEAKIRLFRSLFRGREDVYAVRWESAAKGTSGYAPARVWVRDSRRTVAPTGTATSDSRRCLPLTDDVVRRHLLGEHVIGLYPLDSHARCRFIVADFDDGGWREDAVAFADTCDTAGVPVLLEISRSGKGAHAWCFFDTPVAAIDARRLFTALLGKTCREQRLLALSSYDRLIPNQDAMPEGGFGSLVALPLQGQARKRGASIFIDRELTPVENPWAALMAIRRIAASELPALIAQSSEGEEDAIALGNFHGNSATPWRPPQPFVIPVKSLPTGIRFTLADGLYIDKTGLPLALVTRFARLAAFRNPQWYENQRQHRSVWNTPMFIDKARNLPHHIWLPRGCLDAAQALVNAIGRVAADSTGGFDEIENSIEGSTGIELVIDDERAIGTPVEVTFKEMLRPDQQKALAVTTQFETGVLVAPPGFGKTVTAAAIIGLRATSTLVLVHRKDLLRQWRARLASCFGLPPKTIGVLGGGLKISLTRRLDIAVVQALTRREDLTELLSGYGQIIVDECHHVGAPSIDKVLAAARPRYLLGLTATPARRDGLEPIMAMQCGPIRHRVIVSEEQPTDLSIRFVTWNVVPDAVPDAPIQGVLSAVAADDARTAMLADIALDAWNADRKILLLTERKSHVEALESALRRQGIEPLVLHGGLGGKRRQDTLAALEALDPRARRCLLATGRLVGEGFDHPPLDTLVLAMPLSWRGTLEQYVGRLHRPSPGKNTVRVIDIDDTAHPMLTSMKRKRTTGYRALGYRIDDGAQLF